MMSTIGVLFSEPSNNLRMRKTNLLAGKRCEEKIRKTGGRKPYTTYFLHLMEYPIGQNDHEEFK